MVKLQVCMGLAPEYSRQGHLSVVFIWANILIVIWQPEMYRNDRKLEGSHLYTNMM